MSRPAVLVLVCLACFLVLLPLAPKKPGLPMQLFGEEPTWFLMASSLARDGDLRLEPGEVHRLFDQFPFTPGARLELASADGWQTVHFARPVPFALFAAPFAAVFGANGPVVLNALLLVLSIGLGASYLRRWNADGAALLASASFFVLSAAFAYLFRMQPQIFVMAAVTGCLAFARIGDRGESAVPGPRREWLSGAALALAIGHEPVLALLAVPVLAGLRRAGWRAIRRWLVGWAATLASVALLSLAWTGSAFPDRPTEEVATGSFVLESPLETPWTPAEAGAAAAQPKRDRGARRSVFDLVEDFGFLLWGRRAGILPYFPWLIPALVLFALGARRSSWHWTLVASLAALASVQLMLEPVAAHPQQIGNPHLVGVYPVFLFLLTRLPTAAIVAGTALGALMTSTLLLTPYGSAVPGASIQAHGRNFPFTLLPFEYPALGRTPGFHEVELHGLDADSRARLWAPADQTEAIGSDLWTLGGEAAELWIESRAELPPLVFNLRNLASNNRVRVRLGGAEESRDFDQVPAEGVTWRAQLVPERATRVRRDGEGSLYYYRLRVDTRLGEKPKWRLEASGNDYLGLALLLLGSPDFLARDVYAVEWLGCGAPPSLRAGEEFLAATRLRNASGHPWPHQGTARVRLSYHWLDAGGARLGDASLRTELPSTLEPGERIASWLEVRAPREPGHYVLEVDPVFENVAWFSTRNGGVTCRMDVEVIASNP